MVEIKLYVIICEVFFIIWFMVCNYIVYLFKGFFISVSNFCNVVMYVFYKFIYGNIFFLYR